MTQSTGREPSAPADEASQLRPRAPSRTMLILKNAGQARVQARWSKAI